MRNILWLDWALSIYEVLRITNESLGEDEHPDPWGIDKWPKYDNKQQYSFTTFVS